MEMEYQNFRKPLSRHIHCRTSQGWSLFAIKVAILDMYIKIFRVPWFVKLSYAFLAVQTAWAIANFLAIMQLCRPLAYQRDKTVPGGQCGNFLASYYTAHIFVFVLDVGLVRYDGISLSGISLINHQELHNRI